MAQGDLFRQFTEAGGVLERALAAGVVNAEQMRDILNDVYTAEINVGKARKDMLKSDVKGLNVLKRVASVGKKIREQQKQNLEFSKKIKENDALIEKLELKILKARKKGDTAFADALTKQRDKMKLDNQMNKVTQQQMRRTIPLLGRMGSVGAAISDVMVSIGSVLGSVFSILGAVASTLIKVGSIIVKMVLAPLKKAFNTFLEIQSTVGNLAADIGLTAEESRALLNNFASLTISAMQFGGTMKDVAMLMSTFSETTGKNRIFNEGEVKQLIELGLGTNLGVQGAAELAASFDNIGISLERTIGLTDKARNMAAKMNLNSLKVLKTYKGLVESLSGIGFGRGLDNLTKLAAKANAIRFDIGKSTEAFTDSFSDLDKAVEAAARMQVLGGKFAENFGDPMQLAFESMNDPAKLAERVTDLVKGAVIKSGSDFIIPPAERKMLKIAAETLGQDYNEIKNTALEQAKIADKMTALGKAGFNLMGLGEEERLGIASLMQLNKQGKYEIRMSDGTTKLLENITDKNQLKAVLDERKKNEDAARQRKNLLERLSLVVDRVMLGFSNVFNKLFGGTEFESFLQMVEKGSEKIAKFIMEDIMGSDGLTNGFKTLIDKATNIFKNIEQIFTNDQKTLGEKIAATLKLLFKDVAVPIISEVLKFTIPILKAGIGKLLEIIGGALPSWLGGNKMKNYGLEMQSAAIADSDLLKTLYGESGQSAIASQMSPDKGGSFLQGAGLYGKAALGAKNIPGGVIQGLKGPFGKNAARLAKVGMKRGGQWGVKAAAMAAKRIPVLGSLASLGFAIYDAFEGDWTGAGLNLLSGAANLANIVAPGVGSAVSMGIDAGNAAREMGAFDDGVIYKDGSYAKFSKGDMVQFIDQAAAERAAGSGGGGSTNAVQHSGVITIKSDDGKVVTWDQMYGARDLIGARMKSINDSYERGFGNYQNGNMAPIQPLL
jgi:hypothetical protein